MLLVQHAAVENSTRARTHKVDSEMVCIDELDRSVAEVVRVRESVGSRVVADIRQPFDIASTARNNIHWCLRVLHSSRVGCAIVDGQEALGIVHMAENREIDAIFVEQGLKGLLTGIASSSAGSIPRAVTSYNEPWGDTAVDARKIGVEEVDLLIWHAEWAAIKMSTTTWAVRCIREVGFGVKHDDVSHSVLKAVPKGR